MNRLTNCSICPRNCHINRMNLQGYCHASDKIKINLAQLHYGEEPVLSGYKGSGTIFFSHCNLRCVFCQNYTISQKGWGNYYSIDECVDMMLSLQDKGAHNINFVTPTQYSEQLIGAITTARNKGLDIPIVWNSNAYEKVETLKRLDGLVDIYLPDLKYAHSIYASKYSFAKDYPEIARLAIKEMHYQVGKLQIDSNGIAKRGLLIRILVLPHRLAGVRESLQWIYETLGNDTYLSIMAQYYPTNKAHEYQELSRGITYREYEEVLQILSDLNFENAFCQELSCSSEWTPKFKES